MKRGAAIPFFAWWRRFFLVMVVFLGPPAFGESGARWAQLADLGFQNFTQESGLPSPIATALAEDSDGFIWIGTESGLARWDGYRFRLYRPIPGDAATLPDGWIQTLHVDAKGRLWVATNSGGLALYDRDQDRFHSFGVGPEGTSHGFVRALVDDGAGGQWIGTEGGLDHVAADAKSFTHLPHVEGDAATPPTNRIAALLRDRAGTLWLGTPSGLFRRNGDSAPFQPVALPLANGKQPFVRALTEDSQGRIWIGTMGQGAYLLEDGALKHVSASEPGQSVLESERVLAIAEAGDGQIWLGTYSAGIFIVDPVTLRTRQVRHDVSLSSSLSNDTVWSFLRQRDGAMWTGTGRGVSHYDPSHAAIVTLFGASSRKDGIRDSNVTSVMERPDGEIWLGLGAEGIDELDPLGHRVGQIVSGPDHPETTLAKDFVWNMLTAPDGDIYLGTLRGLYRTDAAGQHLARLPLTRPDPAASVDAFKRDGDKLWMASWGDGLWLLDIGSKGVTKVLHHEGPERLTDRRINALELTPKGTLWIGTASGLNRFDVAHDSIERIAPAPADPQGLPNGSITSLLSDASGRLWVGTLGGGIALLEKPEEPGPARFRRIGLAEGLPNANVDKILQDRNGDLWVSTDDGVVRIDGKTLALRVFRRDEGLQIPSYWGGAGAVTREGEILFGGGGGLTVIRPDLIGRTAPAVPTVVTEVRLGKSALPGNRFNGEGSSAPLMVAPAANSLEVEFAALDYSAPERSAYSYRLDGYDKDWIKGDSIHRTAAYTNLPPGDYVLRLRGANRDGVWTEKELRIPVVVLPAWYQTWWFRTFWVLAALLGVYAIVHLRTAYLHHAKAELEHKVAERTKSLQEAMTALEEASLTDPLTGLRNRRFLSLNIDQDVSLHVRQHESAGAKGLPPPEGADLIFFLVDIDHFKQINDRYGHAGGDAILTQMRGRLQRVFRDSDYLVRWGGEEFLGVARSASRGHAEGLAERLRASVAEEEFALDDGKPLRVTCSIGFSMFPFFTDQPRLVQWSEVVDMADIGLYIAKRAGRNGWAGLIASAEADRAVFIRQAKENPQPLVEGGLLKVISNQAPDKILGALPAPSSA